MGNNNTKCEPKDKHSQLKYLILKRCEIELDRQNYDNANLVAYNLFWLYPEDEDEKNRLIQLYLLRARKLIEDSKLKEAEKIVKSALQLDPNLEQEIKLGEPFLLKIANNVILIIYELDKTTGQVSIYISKKISGPGKLLLPAYKRRKIRLKGVEPTEQATLKQDDNVFDIIVDSEGKSVTTTMHRQIDIRMENNEGKEIKGEIKDGMLVFRL